MRIWLVVLSVLVWAAVHQIAAPTPVRAQDTCGPNPSPVDAADPALLLDEPQPGARAGAPLAVRGLARVFEAHVSLALFDPEGRVIARGSTQAAAGAPVPAPFAASLEFQIERPLPACLWAFEASARDGSPRNVVQVPLVLLPAAPVLAAELDLGEPRPCIPPPGERWCDRLRLALWNGDAAAWAARGVTDPDARFNETVVLRVRAGDPVAIAAIAHLLGWPYVKVTRLDFGTGREVVEVTNLGSGPQDITGWTVRSPERGVSLSLPGVVLAPGRSCYVLTGRPGGTAGFECRVFVGTPESPPIAPPDGFWSDQAGSVVLVAEPLGLVADVARYSADPRNQPPPPNLQARVNAPTPGQPLRFTLTVGKPRYTTGETVEFTMTVRNVGNQPQTVEFPSGQDVDIAITDKIGMTIRRWSTGRAFTQVFRTLVLQPGEERSFRATWDQRTDAGAPAPPGRYQARARLAATNRVEESNRVTFTIEHD